MLQRRAPEGFLTRDTTFTTASWTSTPPHAGGLADREGANGLVLSGRPASSRPCATRKICGWWSGRDHAKGGSGHRGADRIHPRKPSAERHQGVGRMPPSCRPYYNKRTRRVSTATCAIAEPSTSLSYLQYPGRRIVDIVETWRSCGTQHRGGRSRMPPAISPAPAADRCPPKSVVWYGDDAKRSAS